MKALNAPVKAILFLCLVSVLLIPLSWRRDRPSTETVPWILNTSQHYQLVPNSVSSGHTFQVSDGNRAMAVQLCGLYIPEEATALAVDSKNYLQSLLSQGTNDIALTVTAIDEKGLALVDAFVYTGEGEAEIHLNSEQVAAGMAYVSAQAAMDCANTNALALAPPLPRRIAEEAAAESGLGLWANR